MTTEEGGPAVDASEAAIAELTREAFPSIEAIWREPWSAPPMPGGMSGPWFEISRCLFRCGANSQAVAAMTADSVLGPAIASEQLYVGAAGSGGVLEAGGLPLKLVEGACMEIAARGDQLTEYSLIEVAVGNFRKLRSGINGDLFDGWMLTAFRGIHLSPETPISTPWGLFVHADQMSSEMWAPDGCSAVLSTPIRTFMRPRSGDPTTSMFDSESQQLVLETHRIAQLVSYGLALGSIADDPATAIPLGWGELLPTGKIGGGGAVRWVGYSNRSLPITHSEAADAARWMERLNAEPLDQIDVALRRLVRGLAERLDYVDSLIDAVIAWENLVESRTQQTKSVIHGISALTDWSKSHINRVYVARSKVVHGEPPDDARSKDFATDALRIGLDALRSLFDNHPGKLEMTSEERVAALGFDPDKGLVARWWQRVVGGRP